MSTHPYSRRRTATVACAVVTMMVGAAGLAGCSGSSNAPATAAATTFDKNASAEITYAIWDQNQVKAIEANIKGFNATYPNVKVKIDVSPWDAYWTKLQTEATSNTLPDVFWMNGPNFQLYAAGNKLAPATEQVKSGAVNPSNYSTSLVDLYTYKGVQYGMPKDFDTIGVWVNTALLKKAGVALPSADWTWADFQKMAADVSTKLKADGVYGGSGNLAGGQATYYDTIFQAGGDVISADGKKSGYDTPQAAKGVQFWTDLIKSGASPTVKQLADTAPDKWFLNGKLAMIWNGSWFSGALVGTPLESSVVAYPLPKGDKQATVIHGLLPAVAANSKNMAAAQAFQSYLVSKEAQQQQGDMGAVIPAFNGTQEAYVKSLPNANLKVFIDAVAYSRPLPTSKNGAAWTTMETNQLPAAFDGSTPVATVLSDLAAKMNAALAKE